MLTHQRHLFDIPDDVAYLNTAYMSPLLTLVVEAMEEGTRLKARPWTLTIDHFFEDVEKARGLIGTLFNVSSTSVSIIPAASYGLTTAARNLPLKRGEAVILLKNQFPSHTYPWKQKAREVGAKVIEVDVPLGDAATDHVLAAMDENTAIAALPNVLWTNGAYVDLMEVKARCREVGAALVLDLTQSAGALQTDLGVIDPDFAVVANYKWMLGPYSTGFMYVAPQHHDGVPLEEGWITRKGSRNFARLTENTGEFEAGAIRYDMGERANFALMPGVVAALEQIKAWEIAQIEATLSFRNEALCKRLNALGLETTAPENRGAHFIGAKVPEGTRSDLLEQLAASQVYLSERNGSLRITPHLWNTEHDVDRLCEALARLL